MDAKRKRLIASEIDSPQGLESTPIQRRSMLVGGVAAFLLWSSEIARAADPVSIGLNPLFLDSDIQLLSLLQTYLLPPSSAGPFSS